MATTTSTPNKKQIAFGFLHVPLQLLDMAGPMDVLSNITTDMVTKFADVLPGSTPESRQQLIDNSLDITFYHIGPTMEPVHSTGNFLIQPTHTIENCPDLDYLLVGGPAPEYALKEGEMPEGMKQFIRQQTKCCQTVFATCTGAMVLAAAGVLDGTKATVNHALLGLCRQSFPTVEWDEQLNWVVDGKFWTAGGACAGMDMVAHWTRTKVGDELIGLCTHILEYQPRDVHGKVMSYLNGRGEYIAVTAAGSK